MFVKSIPVVNFINVKRTNFLYEHGILAAFSSYMYVEKRLSYKKFVRKMFVKLIPRIVDLFDFGTSVCLETKSLASTTETLLLPTCTGSRPDVG